MKVSLKNNETGVFGVGGLGEIGKKLLWGSIPRRDHLD